MFRAQRAWLSIFLCLAAVALMFAPEKVQAQSNISKEYQIKAAFIFHFAQFVEWPGTRFTNGVAQFRIGILGENPFGGALDEMVKGETIANHKVVVQYSHSAEDLKNCQVVFVCKTEEKRLQPILKQLDGHNSLTVGECDGFARSGGVINFLIENGKVHFEINPDAAKREKLEISSQLFRLGKIVTPAPPG